MVAEGGASIPVETTRVVAVGDLHADYGQATKVLSAVGLLDDEAHWIGGRTILVQTGDVMDRGPDSHRLIRLLDTVRTEAREAGGDVIALLGNHEVMNLRGDWRYVEPSDIAQYGGHAERQAALGPDGEDGRFLRSLSTVVNVEGTIFVHGGVHPDFARARIDDTNAAVRAAIDQPGLVAPVLGERGPLWYRGYLFEPENKACKLLDEALGYLKAERMVVGHTTQRDGVMRTRCGRRLFAIDVGIASPYGNHGGALEIVGDVVTAIYVGQDGAVRREPLSDPEAAGIEEGR